MKLTLWEEIPPSPLFLPDLLHSLQTALVYLAHESLVQLVKEYAAIFNMQTYKRMHCRTLSNTTDVTTSRQKLLKKIKFHNCQMLQTYQFLRDKKTQVSFLQ